jgi:hypothetical protein
MLSNQTLILTLIILVAVLFMAYIWWVYTHLYIISNPVGIMIDEMPQSKIRFAMVIGKCTGQNCATNPTKLAGKRAELSTSEYGLLTGTVSAAVAAKELPKGYVNVSVSLDQRSAAIIGKTQYIFTPTDNLLIYV